MSEVNDKLERLLLAGKLPEETQIETINIDYYRTQMADFVLHLLIETAHMRHRAVSYRDFNVAAGAYALRPGSLGHTIARNLGVNVKVDDTDTINIHAEDLAVGKAKHNMFEAVSVLTVIGPTQEDHASGLHTSTLHPCGRCRGRLSHSEMIRDDTLVVTARQDFTVIDVSDLGGIKRLHEDGDTSGVATFRLSRSHDLFRPVVAPADVMPLVLGDVYEVDSSEWDETIGNFLTHRVLELSK